MIRFLSSIIILFLYSATITAQPLVINGFVEDSISRERLVGASVQIGKTAVLTNNYGYFSLKVPKTSPDKTLTVRFVGYHSQTITIEHTTDTTFLIKLINQVKQLEAVTIQSSYLDRRIEPGKYRLPLQLLRQAPALLGEADLLKFIQTLPGVQGGTEGTAGIHVRGGSPDQNLILLDGMPIYNASHLFGFFSVFNPEAISSADFYKSAIQPALADGCRRLLI
jgi:hypothetical protein